jgi:hypothetical protein
VKKFTVVVGYDHCPYSGSYPRTQIVEADTFEIREEGSLHFYTGGRFVKAFSGPNWWEVYPDDD